MAKIKEVAELAGVAPSSVSRALSDHPDVSEEMKRRVLRAADELGYRPNLLAQGLRSGQTRTIGFIVRDISIPTFAGIVRGAEEEFESKGYSILLTNSLQRSSLEAKHIEMLSQRRVDGLIISLQSESSSETIRALGQLRIPIVLLDRELDSIEADSVCFAHSVGVCDAVEALLELGHRRVAFIGGPAERRASRDRLDGYVDALENAGLDVDDALVVQLPAIGYESARQAIFELLGREPRPTAIVAADGNLGVEILTVITERGIELGRDMTLVVCDDHALLRMVKPPISVVARDVELMGRTAAQLLLARLRDGSALPRREVLPTTFIRRALSSPSGVDSVAVPALDAL